MTQIAYMTRESWAQDGTSMVRQSAVIRQWLGGPTYIFATSDSKKFNGQNSADKEFVNYIALRSGSRQIMLISELQRLIRRDEHFNGTIIVLHPYKEDDCELLRKPIEGNHVSRLFVIVWSPTDMVRFWLDGVGASNLDAVLERKAFDATQLEAARCMVSEQYNGLSTGNGKAAVVQLIRAFTAADYELNKESWLTALFAAGGKFWHAESVSKLISEMQKGTAHRVKQRYRPEILSILQERASTVPSESTQ
ncbi:hypothetical protein [Rothia sp. (in: high G+C Gram-positive bacteria)]|uniref:hypothetical protein n=1 Tax=Rothia sp. (in: high G+C Gram-positive bacteria) TaxID=1885016 RepID=UPI000EDF3CD2|nr:hypothetical protein [Rothia sp. (in: high G+C Gram-positive bacteria)]